MRRLPGPAGWPTERRSLLPRLQRIVSGLAVNPNSIFREGPQGRRQQMDVRFCEGRNHRREAQRASWGILNESVWRAPPSARQENRLFS